MWFEQIQRIAKLAQTRCQPGQLLIIAVDGCGGAGKSSLCQALVREIELWTTPQLLPLDDFYQPISTSQTLQLGEFEARQAYFDLQKFHDSILQPLTQGHSVCYTPYHWVDGASTSSVELKPSGVLIVDGVFSYSKLLRNLVHLSVFVDAPRNIRKKRLLARPQMDTQWVNHWQRIESWHHQYENTSKDAEFLLSGTQD